jgi:Helix-turn-helix domain
MREELKQALAGVSTTVPIAGEILGICKKKAYEAAAKGEIPTIRFGGRLVVPVAALKRLLALEPAA